MKELCLLEEPEHQEVIEPVLATQDFYTKIGT